MAVAQSPWLRDGSVHTEPRHEQTREFDVRGNLVRSQATLSGTLPLDRFHESGAAIAPPPADASAGVGAPVDIETVRYERDAALGSTCSTRFAEVSAIRLPKHDGQKPSPLHEYPTTTRSVHSGHASTAKPRESTPQSM